MRRKQQHADSERFAAYGIMGAALIALLLIIKELLQ